MSRSKVDNRGGGAERKGRSFMRKTWSNFPKPKGEDKAKEVDESYETASGTVMLFEILSSREEEYTYLAISKAIA